jgi:signal transduction histidine kinase
MTTAPSASHLPRSVLLQDLRLALVVAVLALVGFGVSLGEEFQFALVESDAGAYLPGPRALLEVALETLPLTFRHVAPLAVFVVVAAASLASQEVNHRAEPLPLGVLVALYTVVVMRRPLVSAIAAAIYLGGLAVASLTGLTEVSDDQFYTDLTVVVGTMTLGFGVALSRTRARLAERQAADARTSAERRTRQAVEQEKSRIARDMHDNLGHHLSVMVALAAAARRTAGTRPQAALDALASVESVGREALTALRRVVGLLRVDRDQPDTGGQPGLDDLDALAEQVRQAGLPVELSIRGRHRPLPGPVEASAFRIVQEGLTNALTHGGRTRVVVVLTYGDDALEIQVADERGPELPEGRASDRLPTAAEPNAGYGLISMRQRVALLGGELAAGPDGARAFLVTARLPLPADVR